MDGRVNKGWTYAHMANLLQDVDGASDKQSRWFQKSVEVDSCSGEKFTVYTIQCKGEGGSHFAGVANDAKLGARDDGERSQNK